VEGRASPILASVLSRRALIREVLQGSIEAGGAPFELNLYGQKGGWDDPYLFHWEEGAPCQVCGTPLAKIRTGSTGSYICPARQRL